MAAPPDRARGGAGEDPVIVKVASIRQSFGGTARYLERGHQGREVDSQDRVDWVTSRNLIGTEDPKVAAALMDATADRNRRVQEPAYHVKVAFAVDDGPRLGRNRMEAIADDLIRRMQLEQHEVLIVAHKDTDHPHMHLLVNRVHPEHGKAWDRYRDFRRWEKAARELERGYGLREVPGHHHQLEGQVRPARDRTLTAGDVARIRHGERPFVDVLRENGIPRELKAATTWADLEERLAPYGLALRKAGRGLQITDGEQVLKLSALERGSSLGRLEERFAQTYQDYRSSHDLTQRARGRARADRSPGDRRTSSRAGDRQHGRDDGRGLESRPADRREHAPGRRRLQRSPELAPDDGLAPPSAERRRGDPAHGLDLGESPALEAGPSLDRGGEGVPGRRPRPGHDVSGLTAAEAGRVDGDPGVVLTLQAHRYAAVQERLSGLESHNARLHRDHTLLGQKIDQAQALGLTQTVPKLVDQQARIVQAGKETVQSIGNLTRLAGVLEKSILTIGQAMLPRELQMLVAASKILGEVLQGRPFRALAQSLNLARDLTRGFSL